MKNNILVAVLLVALFEFVNVAISLVRSNSKVEKFDTFDRRQLLRIPNNYFKTMIIKPKGPPCARVNVENHLWLYKGDERFQNKWFVDSDYHKQKVKSSKNYYRDDVQKVYNAGYKPNIDMVVSICRESIDPIVNYAKSLKVQKLFLYSKCNQPFTMEEINAKAAVGDGDDSMMEIHLEELENVGREGHTYLTHMLREKDQNTFNPNRWTLFVQGGLEKNIEQSMLAILAAHEHDNERDGTNFINTYRIMDEFCKPLQLSTYFKDMNKIKKWHDEERYQRTSQQGSGNNILDFMSKEITFRGEFLVKNSLFVSLNRPKLLDLQSRLAKGNNPVEGHVLERFWIRVLNANDNCRCAGMPMNEIPFEAENVLMNL